MPQHSRIGTQRTLLELMAAFGSGPFTVADCLALGITRGRLRAAAAQGYIVTLRRGIFTVAETTSPSSSVGRSAEEFLHQARVAMASVGDVPAAIAGRLGAELLELPYVAPHGVSSRIHCAEVIVPEESLSHLGTRLPAVLVRPVRVWPTDLTGVEGIAVTSLLHTAIDVVRMGIRPTQSPRGRARALGVPEALVPLDAATRRLGAESADAAAMLIGQVRPRFRQAQGIRAVDRALPYVDPRSESALESWARGLMVLYDVPTPELQSVITGSDGVQYRVDFCWPGAGVIGEADGLAKYGGDAISFRQAKALEIARQRALEDQGWIIIRWTWDDLVHRPEVLMAHLRRLVMAHHPAA